MRLTVQCTSIQFHSNSKKALRTATHKSVSLWLHSMTTIRYIYNGVFPSRTLVFVCVFFFLLLHLISCRSCGLYKSIENVMYGTRLSINGHPIATHYVCEQTLAGLTESHSIVIHYKCEVTIHSCHFPTIPGAFFSPHSFFSLSCFAFSLCSGAVKHFTLSVYHVKRFRLCIFQMKVMFYRNQHSIEKKDGKMLAVFFCVRCCCWCLCYFVFGT